MDYIINIEQIYVHTPALVNIYRECSRLALVFAGWFDLHHTSLVVRVAISAFGEYFCRMNEIAAFFGNYPLLNMCFYKDS
ncbi:hypothetical protein T07_11398 [Trichinella nelsoni]|uniref:Uncharacterized protein n=1 Tax=Trichinella nelsoni TaxID=6336 RepID=A0A0V0S794_9BILA|nr:hypothetical protein T07_11398 [Trichinella nelsoni]